MNSRSGKNTVSIKDVAKIANVSVPTVSRVINNTGQYTKETEAKVRKVIAEIGYRPSVLAQGMRTNISQNVGIIVPDITNEFFASITLAVQTTLFRHSYSTLICNTNEQPSMQRKHLEMLRSNRVSGIIFISGEDIRDEDLSDGIPKVFVDRVPWNAEAKSVVTVEVDNYTGGLLAAGELLDAGCRRIAALFEGRGLTTQVARYSGFLAAHENHGVEVARDLYLPVREVSYQEGYREIKSLIDSGKAFDGIFCYSDSLAMGAIKALTEAGLRIPEDVLVTGYDDISASQWFHPSITTIVQPVEEMGRLAAELILKQISHDELEQLRYKIPVSLNRRESTNYQRREHDE